MKIDLLANGRRVVWLGNENFRLAVVLGGGHIAALELAGKSANPFWQPPWNSHEPESVTEDLIKSEYGGPPEGRLLASILGHSLALDLYGAPSEEETAAGGVTHGMAGVLPWTWEQSEEGRLSGCCEDTFAKLRFSRELTLHNFCVVIEEQVENLCGWDRPIAWQEHVSFGPPFCETGFWSRANCDLGSTHPQSFGTGASLVPATETHWPVAPRKDGSTCDYRLPLDDHATANDFTGFRVSPSDKAGGFVVGNRQAGFALFYVWPRQLFPWLGIWDEKHARDINPWKKRVSVRAFEFGASPFPQSRRDMLGHPQLFGTPTFLMLPGSGMLWARYVLGVFPDVTEAGDLVLPEGAVTLMSGEREMGRVMLPDRCIDSAIPK